ncbi:MAG TPA: membrane protein insertase YidC [Candidatus Saccharimonadales bacterium]|nr:membrane protein insertase YidC [Candidatus Saccharimonadales bacterium]
MIFAEMMYQGLLFTIYYYAFTILFNKFVLKKRENLFPSPFQVVFLFMTWVCITYFVEKYTAKPVVEPEIQTVSCASGQKFTAPEQVAKIQKPLHLDINFVQEEETVEPVLTEVKTDLARYVFSSKGAVLQSMDFLWQDDAKKVSMLPDNAQCFVLGLQDLTPATYTYVRSYDLQNPQATAVEYQARFDGGIITKTFVVHQKTYQVDVKVSMNYRKSSDENKEHVRLFFPMTGFFEELKGVVNTPGNNDQITFQDIKLEKADTFQQFWFEPKIFGFSQKFLAQVCFAYSPGATVRAYFNKVGDKKYQAILESEPLQHNAEISWSFYMGPKTVSSMKAVAGSLTGLVQYGLLNPISKPLFNLLVYLKEQCGNYGLAIIILSILIKLLLLPFTMRGEKGLKQQAEFEKKRAYLQQKYKHDKAALDKANAELIQKHGLPIFSSCLPMLLNIPVFIALNKVLTSSIELHGASFLWIPDLSAADPYYILPILICVGMAMTPSAAQQGPRQMASRLGMALFVGAFTAYLAAGLAMFIALNTLLGIAQTYIVRKISSPA